MTDGARRTWTRRIVLFVVLFPIITVGMAMIGHRRASRYGANGTVVEGVMLCIPLVGARTRVDSGNSAASVHEGVHERQCREQGALGHYFSGVTNGGRLRREAEAFCAQAGYEIAHGANAYLVRERVIDDIEYGYMGMRTLGPARIRAEFGRTCPRVNASADSIARDRDSRRAGKNRPRDSVRTPFD